MTFSPEPLFDSKAFLSAVTRQIDACCRSHHDDF
ncbi:UvrABC system protein C [Aeromonas salmonicida]|nr:UvrABC system protein C [Aeromonas salmonicida]SUU72000.1 UvrABC system protein C [Aeromonas salmonicida]